MGIVIAAVAVIVVGIVLFAAKGLMLQATKGPAPKASRPAASTSGPKLKIHWLVARSGVDKGKAWHIGARRVTIGRGPSNFVQLKDSSVSRVQCQVVPDGDGLSVIDMTSANGTFVNGKAVRKHVLADGDLLRLAKTEQEYKRTGDFDNAAFERKEAGNASRNTTRAVAGLKRLAEAEEHLLRAGGDIPTAAEAMGVSLDEFKSLIAE